MLVLSFTVEGRGNSVVVDGAPYVFARTASGSFVLPSRCPHRGGPLQMATLDDSGRYLRCPWHERRTSVTRHRLVGLPAVRRGNAVTAVFPQDAGSPVEHVHVPVAPCLRSPADRRQPAVTRSRDDHAQKPAMAGLSA